MILEIHNYIEILFLSYYYV